MRPGLFRSKADTLQALTDCPDLNIPEFFSFTLQQWSRDRTALLARAEAFAPGRVAVRSSCLREDGAESSGAGEFLSLLHVDPGKAAEVAEAVDRVLASYGPAEAGDQVVIQAMVPRVSVSGVIMTRIPDSGAPYYAVDYDDESGRTDTVTGGVGACKTVFVFKEAGPADFDSARLRSFVDFARRLQEICGRDDLDIEFCQDRAGILHLFQVRPLCTGPGRIPGVDGHVTRNIGYIKDFVDRLMQPRPRLFGRRTILGVMPDWNPAEMIGISPRRLASSLYRELITRDVWSRARRSMGYREMPPAELMVLIAGRPFIDARASFNSFLPRGLSDETSEILVSAWLERLDLHPQFHDKVEFEVAQTVLDFSFDRHLDRHYPGLLNSARREEFRRALLGLTLNCLRPGPDNPLDRALAQVQELGRRQALRPLPSPERPGPAPGSLLASAALLIDECRDLGTLPFSVAARCGFMAESLLRTAVGRGALDPARLNAFKTSVQTVAGEMSADFLAVSRGRLDRETFMARYGHLRPGSYDLLSRRYAERGDLFAGGVTSAEIKAPPRFEFSARESRDLLKLMAEAGLEEIGLETFERFARTAIAGREKAKFIFSRNLSDALEILAAWGESIGLSREDVSFLTIRDCLHWDTHSLLNSPAGYFREKAAEGREFYDLTRSLKLGYLIRSTHDVYVVPQHRSAPNFVGRTAVEAETVRLYADSRGQEELGGRVVCIENADPGFDWIFTRRIAGLVTMFGGANSHMAIRCAEYGLPAAIGVGEKLFSEVVKAGRCRLNPGGGTLAGL